jgi:hypothetical protein
VGLAVCVPASITQYQIGLSCWPQALTMLRWADAVWHPTAADLHVACGITQDHWQVPLAVSGHTAGVALKAQVAVLGPAQGATCQGEHNRHGAGWNPHPAQLAIAKQGTRTAFTDLLWSAQLEV